MIAPTAAGSCASPRSCANRRGPLGTACGHLPDSLATRKNPRRPHGLRQLDRCLHHRDPLRVTISSLDSRNQGAAALEVLFHEGSHGIAEPVQAAIIRECRQRDKLFLATFGTLWFSTPPVKLSAGAWHLCATAGDQEDSVSGGGYTPYAVREGLYQRGWSDYFKLLQKFWQPYLDGNAPSTTPSPAWSLRFSGRNPIFFFSVALLPIVRRTPIC